jgi:hypothetical protein
MVVFAIGALTSGMSAQSITGKWNVHYPMRIMNVNGEMKADTGLAVVTIEQKGDSVSGTWLATNTPVASTPRTFTGTFKNGSLQFTAAKVQAKINRGGEDETVEMVTYYEGKLTGDKLAGTMHSESLDGSISSPPMEWSGERAKD